MSLLVIYWILALFFNILTADDKYSLPNSENLPQSIHVQLCKKEKTFSKFLAAFLESKLSFEHWKKDDRHSSCIFQITKDVVRYISKTPSFRTAFDIQHNKSVRQHFYLICSPLCGKLSCKMSFLVTCEILGLFVNLLIADYKYSLRNSQNLPQPIQMQFFKNFCSISKFYIKVWTLWRKYDPHRLCVLGSRNCARRG